MMTTELSLPPFSKDEMRLIQQTDSLDAEKLNHYTRLFSNWISTQKQLPQCLSTNVVCIQKFLSWSNLDFESAKKKFLKFCYNTITHSEFLCERSVTPDGDLKSLEHCYFFRLPKITADCNEVVMLSVQDCDKIDFPSAYRTFAICYDHYIYKSGMTAGFVLCLDLEHYKAHHYAKVFNAQLWRFLMFSERNYPMKPKHVLILNCHPLIEKGVQISKTFLTEKIASRIEIVHSHKDLQKYLPLELIPSDYGGEAKSMSELTKDWAKEITTDAKLLEQVTRLKPTGPVPAEVKAYEQEFGVDGSFRKLTID